MTTIDILKQARAAWPALQAADTDRKNAALNAMADAILDNAGDILAANQLDVDAAREYISAVMLDRLRLTGDRVRAMADGIREVAALPDPVGAVIARVQRPNGLVIERTRVAMGVIAIIYESRPNVTSDAAALALKAGSACVLRGGKEAFNSANAIVAALQQGLESVGLPAALVQLVQDTTRQSAADLMKAVGLVDLLIPRGGAGLISAVTKEAKVPCIQTGTGICHVYVDRDADQAMALDIIDNAKTSRPSVCNAEEVLLVHRSIAAEFLPKLKERLVDARAAKGLTPVELRLDPEAAAVIPGTPAGERDFDTEFLDYILAVKVVGGVDEAIAHIAKHSTGHSEAVVSRNAAVLDAFAQGVDSAANGHLHPKAPRPRPHGPGGADDVQVHRQRKRADTMKKALAGLFHL